MKLKRSIQQHILLLAMAGLMTHHLACAGTPGDDDIEPTESKGLGDEKVMYDGETVFRGVFFNTGPVAPLLADLWNNPRIQRAREQMTRSAPEELGRRAREQMLGIGVSREASNNLSGLIRQGQALARDARPEEVEGATSPGEVVDKIIASMRSADPQFFRRFGEDMQSGDQVRVAAAVKEGSKRLLEEMGSLVLPGPKTFAEGEGTSNWLVTMNYAAAINVVAGATVAAAAAVVVVAAVAVVVVFIEVKPWRPGADSGLEPDRGLERDMAVNLLTLRLSG